MMMDFFIIVHSMMIYVYKLLLSTLVEGLRRLRRSYVYLSTQMQLTSILRGIY